MIDRLSTHTNTSTCNFDDSPMRKVWVQVVPAHLDVVVPLFLGPDPQVPQVRKMTVRVEMLEPKPCAHVSRPDGMACVKCNAYGRWPNLGETLDAWYIRRRQEQIEELNRIFDHLEAEYKRAAK